MIKSTLPITSYTCQMSFDIRFNQMNILHCSYAEPWRVTLIDTGDKITMTGGRLKRVKPDAKPSASPMVVSAM